jgi:hypothetical protein
MYAGNDFSSDPVFSNTFLYQRAIRKGLLENIEQHHGAFMSARRPQPKILHFAYLRMFHQR